MSVECCFIDLPAFALLIAILLKLCRFKYNVFLYVNCKDKNWEQPEVLILSGLSTSILENWELVYECLYIFKLGVRLADFNVYWVLSFQCTLPYRCTWIHVVHIKWKALSIFIRTSRKSSVNKALPSSAQALHCHLL